MFIKNLNSAHTRNIRKPEWSAFGIPEPMIADNAKLWEFEMDGPLDGLPSNELPTD